MLANGFISEVRNYERLGLGKTEKLFLRIISMEPTSAYRISVGLKRGAPIISYSKHGTILIGNSVLFTGIKSMAYKNVRKRISRLHSLGLIEQIHGNFKRNAKIYKLTPRGLFERLMDKDHDLPDIMGLYKNCPIIETLIYQYFELETIANFGEYPLIELRNYLTKCCEAILNTLDDERYQIKRLKEWRGYIRPHQYDLFSFSLDETITNEAKNFVFKMVNMSKDEDPYQSDPNYRNLFPRQSLLKDKKFIRLLQQIKKDFDSGCKNFL
jgi:hypothetical protein